MEVRLYDMDLSLQNKHEEMELLANIEHIEMYKDVDFGGFIVIDEKNYRHARPVKCAPITREL